MSSGYGSRTVVVGALDTKGAEFAYLKALVESEGVDTLTVDFGTMGEPALTPDVTGAEVAAAGGGRVEKIRRGTWRNFCVEWPSADELLVGAGAVSHHWTPQWEAELEAAYGGAVRRISGLTALGMAGAALICRPEVSVAGEIAFDTGAFGFASWRESRESLLAGAVQLTEHTWVSMPARAVLECAQWPHRSHRWEEYVGRMLAYRFEVCSPGEVADAAGALGWRAGLRRISSLAQGLAEDPAGHTLGFDVDCRWAELGSAAVRGEDWIHLAPLRRSVVSHQASATCSRLQTTRRLANVAGPALDTAATMIAMNIAAGQASAMWPAPNLRSWNACNAVIAAQISIAAKTLQVRCLSSSPEARTATTTFSTVGASTSAAPWNPTASVTAGEQYSSGSNRMGSSVFPAVSGRSAVGQRSVNGPPVAGGSVGFGPSARHGSFPSAVTRSTVTAMTSAPWYCWWRTDEAWWRSRRNETSPSSGTMGSSLR